MKTIIFILLFPIFILAQDKIDPWPIITDTTTNYDIIDPIQHDFILGWNWGSPGKKLDDALNINFYHDFPLNTNSEYADDIRISQQLGGSVIGGRPQDVIFNTQSLYLEPTINVIHPSSSIGFQPTLRNESGAVFGFMKKSNEIKYNNDPLHPDFGKVFLYKDSVTALPKVVLDSIWSRNILRFYNYPTDPIIDSNSMNGKELFISINLKSLEPITPLNKNDVVLTIRLPYKVWSDSANSRKGGYKDSNFVKFRNLPSTTDTIRIYDSRENFRGIRRDTTDSLSSTPGIREIQITAEMLDALGNGTADNNITLSAFALFRTEFDLFGNYKWNPLLEPDWYEHKDDTVYIKELDVEVTYHGNLDIAIDWIRLETPRARDIYDGKYDHDVYTAAKVMMDGVAAEPSNDPKLMRLYGADELLPQQWGLNRYFNLLLDTLSSSETTLAHNPAAHYIHTTGFKEYWTGDNIGFRTVQAAPYIEYALARDSATGLNGLDTVMYRESPETFNYLFGYKGFYKRNTAINGVVNEWEEYSTNDTLNSDYETFIKSGHLAHNTLPFPADNWPYDSTWDKTWNKDNSYAYFLNSTQFKIEYSLNEYYKKQPIMLFGDSPWWANLWVQSEAWNIDSIINSVSLTARGTRPKTGEEISLMTNVPLILGAKGLLYWKKTTSNGEHEIGLAPRIFRQGYLDSLPENEELIYSNEIGGDFIQTPDPNININMIDKSQLRLDKFDYDSNRVYIGLKSARTQVYKIHKWITAVDDELMDLKLQAWHGKGFKEWEEWNPYNSYQHWDESPLRRVVNVDSVRTRRLFHPKANGSRPHNYDPDYESRDSSFFDITLLQDRRDSPQDLFNRRKSVYLGVQNRRTDPLIYRDSNFFEIPNGTPPPPLPSDWHGEIMFFSSAEMDSNVRYGGKDLWGIQQNGAWWQDQWWKRFGVRELKIPINIPVYGNGTYLVAEELGLESLDTLGWWFADSLYHRIDTSLAGGDNLIAQLLPGQGKIIKMSYVPYFFNDPTKDSIPDNDSCYFCDIFNDFDLFEFEVTLADTTLEGSCCYDISFTYNGDCTFDNIPFRLLFDGYTGNTFMDTDPIYTLFDSTGSNIRYKNFYMDLDSNTGTVDLGRYCVSDEINKYRISFLAGKDKGTRFIGCDRELQFEAKCGNIVDPKDCCEGLEVTDDMYQDPPVVGDFCTTLTVDTGFDSDCIFGVSLGNGDIKRTLLASTGSPIDFTVSGGIEFTLCYPMANCSDAEDSANPIKMVKMQFLGKDGTVVCEIEVPVWLPCSGTIDDIGFEVLKSAKPQEKRDSKTFKSESFDVTIWPNPTSGELNVEIDSRLDTEVDIDILNNIGVGLSNENEVQLNKGKNERLYNLDSYSSGIYYLQIKSKDGNIVLPVILNK